MKLLKTPPVGLSALIARTIWAFGTVALAQPAGLVTWNSFLLSASAPAGGPPPALLDAELVGLSLGEEDCGLELEEVLDVDEEGDSVDVELVAEDVVQELVEELVEELTVTGASEAHEVSRTAVAAVARQAVRRMP